MPFRIGRREPVRRAVRRVAAEELAAALASAKDEARPLDERVHEVRVHLKRARAALRLARRRRRTDHALRDAARALARARDEAIARATLVGMGAPAPGAPTTARDAADLARAAAALQRIELGASPRRRAGRDARRAFVRSYREARRRLRDLRAEDAAERFHAWRKDVKRLALQARLLKRVAPALARELRAPLEALAERLGDLHDLSVAETRLGPHATAADLLATLRGRGAKQRLAALARGRRTLARRPGEIRRRLRAQWRDR